jgi:hypothetical integral membrane protein (TIGR02206 family)
MLIIVTGILGISRGWEEGKIRNFAKGMAVLLVSNMLIRQIVLIIQGEWSAANSLPLQMCSFSVIWAAITLWRGHQLTYELLLFWGAGALHSFLTPELDDGNSLYNHVEYTISHAGILASGLYATLRMGMLPRPWSWLRVLGITQLVLPVIGLVNYALGANYMYIARRPLIDNPFLIGEWPWYILGLEFAALLHFVLFYGIHRILGQRYSPVGSPSGS